MDIPLKTKRYGTCIGTNEMVRYFNSTVNGT